MAGTEDMLITILCQALREMLYILYHLLNLIWFQYTLVTLHSISFTLVHSLYCTFQSQTVEVVDGHIFDRTFPYDHSYVCR